MNKALKLYGHPGEEGDDFEKRCLKIAGGMLGGLLGERKSKGGLLSGLLGKAGSAARRRGTTKAAGERVDAAENKLDRLSIDLEDLEAELTEEVIEIDTEWMDTAKGMALNSVGFEATDAKIAQISLTWLPID
jgi:hypothetical protein